MRRSPNSVAAILSLLLSSSLALPAVASGDHSTDHATDSGRQSLSRPQAALTSGTDLQIGKVPKSMRKVYVSSPIGESKLNTMQRQRNPASLIQIKAKRTESKGDDSTFDLEMKSKLER